jgi:phage terminase small subunit
MPTKKILTEKQKRFADLYIESCNATEAYLEIYQCKSEAGARASASKLLTNPNIERYIRDRRAAIDSEVLQRQIATRERVLQEETCIAMSNIGEIFDENGKIRELHDMPEELLAAIKRVKYDKFIYGYDEHTGEPIYRPYIKEITFNDKGQALARLEKVYGMNVPEKHEHDITADIRQILIELDGMDRGKLPQEND